MARPKKKGLTYFPVDVDLFDADYRVIELVGRFGTAGIAVYLAVLCMIYRAGYCLMIPRRSLLAQLARMTGGRVDWDTLGEIVEFFGEVGLLDRELLEKDVLTSHGVQLRYAEATAKRKAPDEGRMYWLLEEEPVTGTETLVSAAKTPVSDTEST